MKFKYNKERGIKNYYILKMEIDKNDLKQNSKIVSWIIYKGRLNNMDLGG